jgi:hypothetical protein
LIIFLNNLDQQNISYELAHNRDEAIMVTVALPGQRWEIEFLTDGSVEVEKFVSNGEIYDGAILEQLLAINTENNAKTVAESAVFHHQRQRSHS